MLFEVAEVGHMSLSQREYQGLKFMGPLILQCTRVTFTCIQGCIRGYIQVCFR